MHVCLKLTIFPSFCRYIDKLEHEKDKLDIEFDVSSLNKRERTHSTPARELKSVALSPIKPAQKQEVSRSRSLSPVRRSRETGAANFRQGDLRHRLLQTERKLEDTKNILRLKASRTCVVQNLVALQ